ncbi:heat-shock protein, partial [Pseudomonas sp. BJa5]|nr:heat-shock protein [Pseudomonas sp. BGr12]
SQLALGSMRYDIEDTDGLDRLFKLIEQRAGHWLEMEVEETKIELTHNDRRLVDLNRVESGLSVELTRALFEESIDNHHERLRGS